MRPCAIFLMSKIKVYIILMRIFCTYKTRLIASIARIELACFFLARCDVAWARSVIDGLPHKPEVAVQAFESRCKATLSHITNET